MKFGRELLVGMREGALNAPPLGLNLAKAEKTAR
jgi:hypothetical protein